MAETEVILNRLGVFNELGKLHIPEYLIYAITGGRGSGKTKQVALNLLIVGAECKKRIVSMREIWTTIEESSYQELIGFIDAGMFAYGWRYNKTEIWNTATGSSIKFRGMLDRNTSSRESLKGLSDVDIYWIDEAQTVTKATLEVFLPLLRKENCCAIFTFNRISRKLPVWTELFLDNPPPDTYFLEVNYTANVLLPQSFMDRAELIKRERPEEYKRDYLNSPDSQAEARVVPYWSADNIKPVNYISDIDLHITCDFNISPNCWELAHKTDNKVFFFTEYCIDLCTPDLIRVVLDDYPHPNRIIINGDASGDNGKSNSRNTDYQEIKNELIRRGYRQESSTVRTGKRFKFELRKANGSRKERFTAWNHKIINILTGEREVIVSPKCKKLIYNCEELKIIPGTSEFEIPSTSKIKADTELKFLGHPFDAASYLVNTYWPVRREKEPIINRQLTALESFIRQK